MCVERASTGGVEEDEEGRGSVEEGERGRVEEDECRKRRFRTGWKFGKIVLAEALSL